MIFDPMKPLSDAELEKLSNDDFDRFLEYLDSKAEYLKQYTKPLSSYMTKRYSSISTVSQGKELSNEQIKKAGDIGKENDKAEFEKIRERFEEMEKNNPKYTDEGIKNIKTHRSQWFD
jgi:molecular chaperone DnaK (HSP70)|tara:strand:+ start:676 stop:1029 length:354 start_codon:yes stop_codon:yes gene_type:complete